MKKVLFVTAIFLLAGCGHTVKPGVAKRSEISQYPMMTFALAASGDSEHFEEGNWFTRNWVGWTLGIAGTVVATDYFMDGDLVGLFDDSADPQRVETYSDITSENNLVTSKGNSSVLIRDVPDCDFNFMAEDASSIECDVYVGE